MAVDKGRRCKNTKESRYKRENRDQIKDIELKRLEDSDMDIKDTPKLPETFEYERIVLELIKLYMSKNSDYGNSFGKTFEQFGLISAVTRIADKYNRLESLVQKNSDEINHESVEDTLKDLASYSIMTLIELEKEKKNEQ